MYFYEENDVSNVYTIFIIGININECIKSIQYYRIYPNAIIYMFDIHISIPDIYKIIGIYGDRIKIVRKEEENIKYNNNDIIHLCYLNNCDYNDILNKININRIKMLIDGNDKIIHNNKCNIEIYNVYYQKPYLTDNTFYFTHYGVNEVYPKNDNEIIKKVNNIIECQLNIYNPFLQRRGYMKTSAYLHIYWNKLYINKDMIGFSEYIVNHKIKYTDLNKNIMYICFNDNLKIVNNEMEWNANIFSQITVEYESTMDFILCQYNNFFNTNYSKKELENLLDSCWKLNIYPIKIYVKLCQWLELLVENIYSFINFTGDETTIQYNMIGHYMEKSISMFNAFQIYEGQPYYNLYNKLNEDMNYIEDFRVLYNYSPNIHTKLIENISSYYQDVVYSMFKAQCNLNGFIYNCERVHKNNKTGLYLKRSDWTSYKEYGFDIDGEDPRLFIYNDIVYILFSCLSPTRCIALTEFNNWNPVVLNIENFGRNPVEKNWAPFVKDAKLFFVYNFDPLVIIEYNFNKDGICNVVFKQDNVSFPIDTFNTYIRGGSNLIHYKDEYYIGGTHSIFSRVYYADYYTHIVLLNTQKWEISYLSKPVMYCCDGKIQQDELPCNTTQIPQPYKKLGLYYNILNDITPNLLQYPISILNYHDKFYITINVRDTTTLLYEIKFKNLFDFIKTNKSIGYYNNYIKDCITNNFCI